MSHRSRRRRRPKPRPLLKWFIVGGIIGIAVAFFFLYALSHDMVAANYAVIFWPTSMAMLGTSEDALIKTLTIAFAFAGNFLLYGAVAALVGAIVRRLTRRSEPALTEKAAEK
jgi:drug/metabolite transporter (DMT)-like permease